MVVLKTYGDTRNADLNSYTTTVFFINADVRLETKIIQEKNGN